MKFLSKVFKHNWRNSLYTSTQIVKIGDYYYIEDCWHGRIIFRDKLSGNIGSWHTLSEKIGRRTLATDGKTVLVDDSENDRVLVYKVNESPKVPLVYSDEILVGGHPHYILYDDNYAAFFILSSMGGDISIVDFSNGKAVIRSRNKTVDTSYVRSFSIIDGFFLLTDL